MVKIMKNKNLQNIFLNSISMFFVVILFFSFFTKVEAAKVSIDLPEGVIVGQQINVDVFIDPEKTSINSIQAVIKFSEKHFDFVGFSTKQSTIPVWVENPKEKKSGEVSFSGVIPGGLDRLYDPLHSSNSLIPVVRLFFIPKEEGITRFSFGEVSVLKNDGLGTPTNVSSIYSETKIVKNLNVNTSEAINEDKNPPVPFSINLIERSLFGRSPKLAVFSAQDNEGGISKYEVSVGSLSFAEVESPFPLPYRLFSYILTVRAFDYSGNFREQQITIPADTPYVFLVPILLIVLFIVGFFRYRFYNRVRS